MVGGIGVLNTFPVNLSDLRKVFISDITGIGSDFSENGKGRGVRININGNRTGSGSKSGFTTQIRKLENFIKTLKGKRVSLLSGEEGGGKYLYSYSADFRVLGDARREGDRYILTENAKSQRGVIWTYEKLDLTKDWVISFKAYFGDRTCGADGIALVFQNSSPTAAGWYGGGMGFGGIGRSFAVEFDTWKNSDVGDINGNHVGFDINGSIRSVAAYGLPYRLESDREIPITVVWDYKGDNRAEVKVKLMGKTYSYTISDITSIFGSTEAYLGFTAATGGEKNLQYVRDIRLEYHPNEASKEIELTTLNGEDNPKTLVWNGLRLTAWVEPEGDYYKVWFNLRSLSGNKRGKLLLLDKEGRKPPYAGGNPFQFSFGEGEETTQYWVPVYGDSFPLKLKLSLFSDYIPEVETLQYPTAENIELNHFVGSAYRDGNRIILTPDQKWQKGAVWSNTLVDLRRDWEITFNAFLGYNESGADGITFTLQAVGNCCIGSEGGGLGYAGIGRSLAVELDTWKNSDVGDINGNHIGFDMSGSVESVSSSSLPFRLESGGEIPVKISWHYLGGNRGLLKVWINGGEYQYEVSDINSVFGTDKVFIGFTGATGGAKNLQYISDFGFTYTGGKSSGQQKGKTDGMWFSVSDHVASIRATDYFLSYILHSLKWLKAFDPFSAIPLGPTTVWIGEM